MIEAQATRRKPATRGERAATRRRLLKAADELFYTGGIRATGVEAVAQGAGVTKMTLYSHFSSKDELVAAYLAERDARWRQALEEALGRYDGPKEKLLAVFDSYRKFVVSENLRGCAFVNCSAEFPDRKHPARRVAREHKTGVRRRLSDLATEAGADDPEALAERLFLLLEGAYVTAAIEGDEGVLGRARDLAAETIGEAVTRREGPRK